MEKGESARLFMETKKGNNVITFRIGHTPAGISAEAKPRRENQHHKLGEMRNKKLIILQRSF